MEESTSTHLAEQVAYLSEALRRAEERATTGQLALEVMHEVKNPLEALGHLTYLARIDADDPGKVRKYMEMAEEQMATLRHVASHTLGLARTSPAPKPVDVTMLAEAALRIHQRRMDERHVTLVKEMTEGAVAEVYTGEILQVISNLLVNALEAVPPHGVLHVRVKRRNGEVDVVVADNGHGIPAEHIEAIYEPFFTTRADNGGTGLGLALTKKIIDRHGGRIRVRTSVRPGKSGTMFRVSLPLKNGGKTAAI